MDFQHSTIHELADLLAQGKVSAVQILDDFLARIDANDAKIGAFSIEFTLVSPENEKTSSVFNVEIKDMNLKV